MGYLVWSFFILAGILGGCCSHVMSDAGLIASDRSVTYADIRKNPEAHAGKHVLVGGIIAGTESKGDVIQLEVVQLELMSNGVPDEKGLSAGRFLAVSGALLDPLLYRPGLLVTIIGEIKGQRVHKIEGADYRYPLISAKEIRIFRATDLSSSGPAHPYQNQIINRK